MKFIPQCLPHKKLRNARDLGGIPVEGGKVVKKGKLIRSGRLCKLPAETVDALLKMGIDNVIDMRVGAEIRGHEPTILKGATYHYIPLITTAEADNVDIKCMMSTKLYMERKRLKREFRTADDYMKEIYRLILFSPQSQKKLKQIFDLFLAEENCILWHCNSGKDRTGIVAMLLLSVLGVSEEVILDDYEISYYFMRRRRRTQRFFIFIVPMSIKYKKILRAYMYSKREYLQSAIDEIKRAYGSVTAYVKEALGVTDEEMEILRNKYVEDAQNGIS